VSARYRAALERVSAVRGVQGSMLVSASDGLIVAELLMEDVDGRAVAALAASLAGRLRRTTESAGLSAPSVIHLRADSGSVLAVPAPDDLLVVAIARPDANIGLARLELIAAAAEIS
jgi:predicted regulator of Ras-like GTPase activity (Roadblock/LC7/MglB family)